MTSLSSSKCQSTGAVVNAVVVISKANCSSDSHQNGLPCIVNLVTGSALLEYWCINLQYWLANPSNCLMSNKLFNLRFAVWSCGLQFWTVCTLPTSMAIAFVDIIRLTNLKVCLWNLYFSGFKYNPTSTRHCIIHFPCSTCSSFELLYIKISSKLWDALSSRASLLECAIPIPCIVDRSICRFEIHNLGFTQAESSSNRQVIFITLLTDITLTAPRTSSFVYIILPWKRLSICHINSGEYRFDTVRLCIFR